ncbi:MAG TPA: tryptophan--tRNA ligase [Alphaproteobacteria bacterium]|nr:tryptophan--tRNA ligase [Alphaproteobacteria bacterium]
MGRILSGMQPTGNLHLGNYLGALKNWVKLQDSHECYYCVVDLHAITVPQEPAKLKSAVRETAAAYIAAGIDTKKSTLFVQSAVPAHCELSWILSTFTPLGWLNRMTQFKDKSAKSRDLELLGLYAYPVLMAADILVYKATHVPVGEDQKQHLELARDIAGAFNRQFGEFFPLPEPLILGEAARVMSLRDGTKKMSKSDESDYSRINLTDDADAIALKVKKAKTDPEPLPDDLAALAKRPEADNLVTIFAALADRTKADVLKEHAGAQFSRFKKDLTDLAVAKLAPITEKMRHLLKEPAELDQILIHGAEHANALADKHMREVKEMVGLWGLL